MTTDRIKDKIEEWSENHHLEISSVTNMLHYFCDRVDELDRKIKSMRDELAALQIGDNPRLGGPDSCSDEIKIDVLERIVRDRIKNGNFVADSSDSEAESELKTPFADRCCGNCKFFSNEDALGQGICDLDTKGCVACTDECDRWEHKPFTEGEAVLYKTHDSGQAWKLGYYCCKTAFGHTIYHDRRKGRTIGASIVEHYDTFNPYEL